MSSSRRLSKKKERASANAQIASASLSRAWSENVYAPAPQGFDLGFLRYACVECGEKTSLRRCGTCGHVRYCSQKCQRRGWRRVHRRSCGTAPRDLLTTLRGGTASQILEVLVEWGPAHPVVVGPSLLRLHRVFGDATRDDVAALCPVLADQLDPFYPVTSTRDTNVAVQWTMLASLLSNFSFDDVVYESQLPERFLGQFAAMASELMRPTIAVVGGRVTCRSTQVAETVIEGVGNIAVGVRLCDDRLRHQSLRGMREVAMCLSRPASHTRVPTDVLDRVYEFVRHERRGDSPPFHAAAAAAVAALRNYDALPELERKMMADARLHMLRLDRVLRFGFTGRLSSLQPL